MISGPLDTVCCGEKSVKAAGCVSFMTALNKLFMLGKLSARQLSSTSINVGKFLPIHFLSDEHSKFSSANSLWARPGPHGFLKKMPNNCCLAILPSGWKRKRQSNIKFNYLFIYLFTFYLVMYPFSWIWLGGPLDNPPQAHSFMWPPSLQLNTAQYREPDLMSNVWIMAHFWVIMSMIFSSSTVNLFEVNLEPHWISWNCPESQLWSRLSRLLAYKTSGSIFIWPYSPARGCSRKIMYLILIGYIVKLK